MAHRTFIWILGSALVVAGTSALAQNKTTIYKELLRPKNATYHHVPIGLCEDYPEETTTKELIRGDMALLRRSGVRLLRISFGWDGIESRKDTYNWLFWDDYVKTAVDEYGITLIPYICYTPSWNSSGDTTNFWNHTPKDYDEFGQFVFDLVTRFKPWIKSWELWNEPDIKAYWSGTSGELAKLTKVGAQAVKRADPDAMVVLAGLAGDTKFTQELFRDYGISDYVDVVNCHNYFETWNPSPIEAIVPYIYTLTDIIQRYGHGQSLWMAEVGYSTYRKQDGYVSDWVHANYSYEHTTQFQAVQLIRTITLALSTNRLAAIAWYEIKDLPPEEKVIGDVNNRHLGVAYVDHTSKPAEKALSFVNTLFGQRNRCIDDEVAVERTIGSESEVHCFENADSSMILVGWLKTHVPGRTFNGPVGELRDDREERISFRLPGNFSGKARVFNELGEEKAPARVARRGKTTDLNNILLKGGEIVVIRITK